MNTCQICEREIKDNTGVIAHHGYKRPDSGWQTDSCMGARNLPYEKSREIIPDAINCLKLQINQINFNLTEITEKNLPIPYFRGNVPSTHGSYDRVKEEYFQLEKCKIKRIEMEIKRLQKRYENFKCKTTEGKQNEISN